MMGKHTQFQSTRPRGARRAGRLISSRTIQFQSTRPRGARHSSMPFTLDQIMFQSTRPRGARPTEDQVKALIESGFNPRARAGRDIVFGYSTFANNMFQSTRPRGARHRMWGDGTAQG